MMLVIESLPEAYPTPMGKGDRRRGVRLQVSCPFRPTRELSIGLRVQMRHVPHQTRPPSVEGLASIDALNSTMRLNIALWAF